MVASGQTPEIIWGVTRLRAYSDPSRPLIPTQVGHPFRRNAATDPETKSATFSSLLGIGGRLRRNMQLRACAGVWAFLMRSWRSEWRFIGPI
ncbi:MAG: hypothetical protein GDA65_19445 [Nitrospira sp. CR1.1]|nr:hypothetical protein [Nitrospira sp. CR1.1]